MKRFLLLTIVLCLACVSPGHAATNPDLHLYMTGKKVKNLQWLLGGHKPSVYRIQAWRYPIDGVYDKRVAAAVKNMKYRLGYPTGSLNGNVAGARFIGYLEGSHRPFKYRKRTGDRIVALQKQQGTDLTHPTSNPKVSLLLSDAHYLISHASLIGYSQVVRMQIVRQHIHLPPLYRYIYEDCSSSITGLYWLAGLPDPNGLGYNGYGYTGTQANHGLVVWRLGQPLSLLRPGDLIFYGGGWPHHHVTMYLGNGRVFSHGTPSGPFDLPVLYRPDAVGAHRYIIQ